MDQTFAFLQLFGGLVFLTLGAHFLISGGASLAMRMGISGTIVGLTVISYGTSLPEFTISLVSTVNGSSELALGNVIGSNIANIGLILGITTLIRPISVDKQLLKRDLPFLSVVTALMIIFTLNGYISRVEGGILLLCGVAYTIYLIYFTQNMDNIEEEEVSSSKLRDWGFIAIGIIGLVIGGQICVRGAVFLAKQWGMTERVIGITVVSIGTSLPELAASLTASIKGKDDMAMGNILGSNLFNLLFVLGATALIHPLSFNFTNKSYVDIGVLAGMTLFLWPVMASAFKIIRFEGAVFIVGYGSYIAWMVLGT
jgi:cation:H+ antiporter